MEHNDSSGQIMYSLIANDAYQIQLMGEGNETILLNTLNSTMFLFFSWLVYKFVRFEIHLG